MALIKLNLAQGVTGTLPTSNYTSGITEADQWRLNTTRESIADSGEFLNSGWERNDSTAFSKLGTGWTESAGVFTAPSTGIYKIEFVSAPYDDRGHPEVNAEIHVTTNNSTYTKVARSNTYIENDGSTTYNIFTSTYCCTFLDVTDTSNVKVKFFIQAVSPDQANSTNTQGNTSFNQTYVTLTRLGDT